MPVNKHADPDVSQFLLARWLGNDRASIRAMGHELLTEPDRTDLLAARLREWSMPALVTCGEAETTWPTAEQRKMAGRLGAAFVGFPGIGHSPNTARYCLTRLLPAVEGGQRMPTAPSPWRRR
jgi:pimeloyl-ACP methyl ester carboxylesterase